MRKVFLAMMALAALVVGCQSEPPVPMQVKVGMESFQMNGNRAALVKAAADSLVVARDSVNDEKTDTVYDVRTTLTLTLDSTFLADKMEEQLRLKVGEVELAPLDSAAADSLIAFLKKAPGAQTILVFAGKATRSQYLQLAGAPSVVLSGFSFHELDPEALADPKVNKLLDEIDRRFEILMNDIADWGPSNPDFDGTPSVVYYRGDYRDCFAVLVKLRALTDKMSPKQKERYQFFEDFYEPLEDYN